MKTPTAHASGASIPFSLMICELISRPTVTMQSVWCHHVSRNALHLHRWTWDRATYTCARLAIHQTEKSFLRLRRSSTATLRANRCAPPAVAITFNIYFSDSENKTHQLPITRKRLFSSAMIDRMMMTIIIMQRCHCVVYANKYLIILLIVVRGPNKLTKYPLVSHIHFTTSQYDEEYQQRRQQ